MYNLLKFEIFKLKYNKTFRRSAVITVFLIVLCVYLSFHDKNTVRILSDSFQGREFGILMNNFEDRIHPKFIEYFYSAFGFCPVISVIAMFLVGSIVIDEYTEGTIKNISAYGHKRVKIYISKLIIICLSIFILLTFLLFGATIVGGAISGWNGAFSFQVFTQTIKFIILAALIYSSLISIYMCLAILIRNKSIFLALCIIAIFLIGSNLSYFADFLRHMPTFMLIEISMSQINLYNIISNCSILIMISTLIGAVIFKNLELK